MRELHVVGLSSDGRHVVLTGTKGALRGSYLLAVSPSLAALLAERSNGSAPPKASAPKAGAPAGKDGPRRRGRRAETVPAEPAAAEPAPPVESKLTPREIQARLRAGHSPERVARAAGVPVDRVTRFFGPVLSERAQVVAAARDATLARARLGPSAAPLGESVAANLALRGVPVPEPGAWDAYRRPDGTWVVRLAVEVRGRAKRPEWVWDPAARTLSGTDAYAAALGHADAATVRSTRARRRAR